MQVAQSERVRHECEAGGIAAIFLLALVLRSIAAARTATIFNDGPTFLALARSMAAGEWAHALTHPYHPLYPALVWLVERVVPGWERAAVGLSVAAGSLAVLALYAFLREAWGRQVAILGALLLALHPYAIRFAADVQSDSLYLMLFLAAVALLFRALRRARPLQAVGAGALAGLAYLTRPEGVGVALIGVALASAAALRGRWRPVLTLRWLLGLAFGFLLVAGPYVLVLHRLVGHWQLSQKKSLLELFGLEGPLAVMRQQSGGAVAALVTLLAMSALWAWLRAEPEQRHALLRLRIGARTLLAGGLMTTLVLACLAPLPAAVFAAETASALRPELCLLVAIGIGSRVRRGADGRALFLAAFAALYASVLFGLVLHYGYLSRRHALPPLMLLLGQAALGAQALGGWLDRHVCEPIFSSLRRPQRVVHVGLALVLIGAALFSLPKALRDHRSEQLAGRLVAEWLADHGTEEGALAADKSKLGYYARRPWRSLRADGALRSLAELEREGVRYVIVEDDSLDSRLLPDESLRADGQRKLRELHRTRAHGRYAEVLELVDSAP